jgi:unsaturated rhamnogalacturonyl hydrolase
MDRRSFVYAATIAAAHSLLAEPAQQKPAAPIQNTESARRIELAIIAALTMQRRDWEQGIFAQALLESGQRERLIQVTRAAMLQQTPDGRMGVLVVGGPTDPAMGGAAYAQAAQFTGELEMRSAVQRMIQWLLLKAPRNADGILYHTFDVPQMWSDGINCAPPFFAAMGFYDRAIRQIEGYRKVLFNPQKKLMTHIWDDGKQQFVDPEFWGGGNGWTAAGLARVIRSLPAERAKDREHVADFAHQVIDGCLAHQRPDGLFYNLVDKPDTFVETNLAQMLAFSIYQGITDGWLPSSYRLHADRMRAAARAKVDKEGFVQGACSAPNFDRPGISTEAQSFCILMESAGQSFQ